MRKKQVIFSFDNIKTKTNKMNKAATSTSISKTTKTSKKAVKSTPVVEETPLVEVSVPAVETTTETVVETVVETETVRSRLDRLVKSKQELIVELKREIVELKRVQRDHDLAVKEASKRGKKKRAVRDDANPRKPSGFASPVVVSDELYSFLANFGVKKGDPIARTDVTRHITSYIKEHDLQNPEHRREIIPDASLKKIFGEPLEHQDPNDTDSPKVFTYLKLQKYLSAHFPKSAATIAAAAAASAAASAASSSSV